MFEKKGCQVLLGIIGVLTIIGLMNTGTCAGFTHLGQQDGGAKAATTVAQVGSKAISADSVDQLVEQARKQQPGGGSPAFEFYMYGTSLDQSINQAATVVLAEQRGLKIDQTVLKQVLDSQFGQLAESEKLQLIQEKQLKPGATEKEFIEAFKKKYNGKTPDEFKADRLVTLAEDLKDPVKGPPIRDQIMSLILIEAYQKDANVTLDDLKKSFDTFNLLRLPIDDPKLTKEQKDEAAKKALADLKGGMKFEDAIKKYSKNKPSEPLPFGRALLENQPDLKVVLDMKPGETTDVLEQLGSPVIYKLVSITPNLPKDFEKTKDQQLKQYQSQKATEALQRDVDKLKSSQLKWTDPGVEFGYDVFKTQNEGFKLGADGLNKKLEELVDKSDSIKPTTALGDKLVTLGRFSAFESFFGTLKPDQQKEKREQRTTILQDVLEKSESIDVRMLLFDNLVASEDYETAGSVLLQAAEFNSGTDQASEMAAQQIRQRLSKAEGDKKIDKEVLLAVKKELARWEQDKLDAQKEQKESSSTNNNVDKELEKLNDPEAVEKAKSNKPADKK